MLLESLFSLLYVRGALVHIICTELKQNIYINNEEETKTKDAFTCNLTRSSDIKQHQNCETLWNKISANEEVIMTVKHWGVDRLHLRFDYHSESNSLSFFSLLLIVLIIFIYETNPHSSVFKRKRMHEVRIFVLFTSRYPVLSFDVLYVQIFITKYIQMNT